MLFNSYIWNLYKSSEHGQMTVARFETLSSATVEAEFGIGEIIWPLEGNAKQFWGQDELHFNISALVTEFASLFEVKCSEDAAKLYESLINEGIALQCHNAENIMSEFGCFGKSEDGAADWLYGICEISFGLYFAHSCQFLPYLFQGKFYQFQKLCEAFDIPIPPVPGKQDWHGRARYYFRLNQSLQEFRALYDLSPAGMCAFLYDFAPEALREQEAELPPPSKVWLITGGAGGNGDFAWLDQSDENSTSHWQGNIDTRRGDILLMHCVSPRSYIHSIWRATTDGFIDPFFMYHSTIWIGSPIKTAHVTFAEMKAHPLLAQKGAIKAHLQGPSGKAFTVEEYQAVLEQMAAKGQDVSFCQLLNKLRFSLILS